MDDVNLMTALTLETPSSLYYNFWKLKLFF